MGKKARDIEDLTRNLEAFFRANLNTEIVAVNAEKAADDNPDNDTPIEEIQTEAWYLQQLPQVWSEPIFVVWGVSSITPRAEQEDNFIYDIEWFFEVIVPDSGEPDNEGDFYKLLRYTRALSQVVTNNVDKIQRGYKFKVKSLIPATASVASKKFRTGGILLSTQMTAR